MSSTIIECNFDLGAAQAEAESLRDRIRGMARNQMNDTNLLDYSVANKFHRSVVPGSNRDVPSVAIWVKFMPFKQPPMVPIARQ